MRTTMVGRSEEVYLCPLTQSDCDVLYAPERLVSEHRLEFRREALERLAKAASEGAKRILIDLRETREVDASGLGVLVLLQKRARENLLSTCLKRTPPTVRHLLHLTRLERLFEFEN